MKKLALFIIVLLAVLFLIAPIPPIQYNKDMTAGQRHWYVIKGGAGNCLSWDSACSFRTAVAKCADGVQDMIWLSPEDHDTDNGSDAGGTTITAKNVSITGLGNCMSLNSRLYNTAASVTHVIQVTGHRVTFRNVRFTQHGQSDIDATLLYSTGNRTNVIECQFRADEGGGSVSDIGILFAGTSKQHYIHNVRMDGLADAGLKTNDVSNVWIDGLSLHECDTGIELTHGDDDNLDFYNVELVENTTGISLAAGVNAIRFTNINFMHNATNVTDGGTYGGLHLTNVKTAHGRGLTYPANAGVTVTGAAAWVQGAMTQIVPASTITTPFRITGFNIQSATANNIYKVEFFYGQATGDNSLGIYEFIDVGGNSTPPPIVVSPLFIVSNSYIGAKIASDSGGADNAVITINYEAL